MPRDGVAPRPARLRRVCSSPRPRLRDRVWAMTRAATGRSSCRVRGFSPEKGAAATAIEPGFCKLALRRCAGQSEGGGMAGEACEKWRERVTSPGARLHVIYG
jgi:hypothetical protein